MIGRIVEVASDGVHLAVDRGFMTVSRDREKTSQIALDDIAALVFNCHGATWSANLTARLSERGAPMVICGSNHAPIALVWPIDGHYEQWSAHAGPGRSIAADPQTPVENTRESQDISAG